MNNNVRLGVEAVLVIVLIIALFLYFSQQQELTDTQALQASAEAAVADLQAEGTTIASEVEDLEAEVADAGASVAEQENAAATAMADAAALAAQLEEAQAAADTAATAQADAEAAVSSQGEAAQAAADTAATAQADAETALADAQQQVTDLQATIDAMNAATPEPVAEETEEAVMMDMGGFPADVFSMNVGEGYTVYTITGDERAASREAIAAVDAALEDRIRRESAHDYAAVMGEGEYILVNQQSLPDGVSGVAAVSRAGFRRATSSEIVTLGENEVARGIFGDNEVRYIIIDGGSMWVITFVSADVASNLEAFDAIVATFDAVEPPEESGG